MALPRVRCGVGRRRSERLAHQSEEFANIPLLTALILGYAFAVQSMEAHMRFALGACSGFVVLLAVAAVPSASAQSIFLTPVPNAPFTAVVEVERTVVRTDGSVANVKSIREMARDSRGRIHNEARTFVPANSTKAPEVLDIHLYDPQTRISTELDAVKHTYYTRTINHPPSTVPPTVRFGSPSTAGVPANDFSKDEDLGSKDIEGVLARGVRQTQVVPAESGEAGGEIVVTDEYWYSEELRINVVMKHNDPRKGSTTVRVTHIARVEPDPAVLEIPEGYTRVGER